MHAVHDSGVASNTSAAATAARSVRVGADGHADVVKVTDVHADPHEDAYKGRYACHDGHADWNAVAYTYNDADCDTLVRRFCVEDCFRDGKRDTAKHDAVRQQYTIGDRLAVFVPKRNVVGFVVSIPER